MLVLYRLDGLIWWDGILSGEFSGDICNYNGMLANIYIYVLFCFSMHGASPQINKISRVAYLWVTQFLDKAPAPDHFDEWVVLYIDLSRRRAWYSIVALWSYGDLSKKYRLFWTDGSKKRWGTWTDLTKRHGGWDMASEGRDFSNLLKRPVIYRSKKRIR